MNDILAGRICDAPVYPSGPKTEDALLAIKPGQEVVYHIGLLPRDRITYASVNKIAKRALQLCEDGYLHLVQRRQISQAGFPYYEYIARGAS